MVFDWTPDGKRILFGSDRSGTMGAWWIPIAGEKPEGTPELVKPDLGQDVRPMGFTRDGSYYYGVRTGMSDVYIAELDFASGRVLVPPVLATQRFAGSNSQPDWSSDGRKLVFLSQRGPGAMGARAIPFPGSIAWAPDGRSLLFVKQPNPRDQKTELWVISVEGGDPRKLDLTAKNMRDLRAHPDGRHIAFTSMGDKSEVWAMENFLPREK